MVRCRTLECTAIQERAPAIGREATLPAISTDEMTSSLRRRTSRLATSSPIKSRPPKNNPRRKFNLPTNNLPKNSRNAKSNLPKSSPPKNISDSLTHALARPDQRQDEESSNRWSRCWARNSVAMGRYPPLPSRDQPVAARAGSPHRARPRRARPQSDLSQRTSRDLDPQQQADLKKLANRRLADLARRFDKDPATHAKQMAATS